MFLFRSFLFRCFYLNVLFLCFYLFCLDLVLIIFCLNRNEQLLVIIVYLFVCKITKSCFRSTRIGMDCNQEDPSKQAPEVFFLLVINKVHT